MELSRDVGGAFPQENRKELLSLLENLPEMGTERSRRQLLNNAGLRDIARRLDVSGPPTVAASEIVDFLCDRDKSFAAFLLEVQKLVGLENQKFLAKPIGLGDAIAPPCDLSKI